MKCPYCQYHFHDTTASFLPVGIENNIYWSLISRHCPNPECKRLILHLVNSRSKQLYELNVHQALELPDVTISLVKPKGSSRPPCPLEVPQNLAEDYTEACIILPDSPKASAALTRRCLQQLLRDTVKVKRGDLSSEIQEVINSGQLPPTLAESIDAIRNIGNFAAHPLKSTQTGEIIAVEPQEAEWNLEVLEELFDFYFVQPERTKRKKAALNQKLIEAGKPPMP